MCVVLKKNLIFFQLNGTDLFFENVISNFLFGYASEVEDILKKIFMVFTVAINLGVKLACSLRPNDKKKKKKCCAH